MRLLLTAFFLFAGAAYLQAEEKMTISSDAAHYDGDEITLEGNVVLENSVGKVFASRAILIKDKEHKTSIDFPTLELFDSVKVELSNKGCLTCNEILCNHEKLKSYLKGDPYVHYEDQEGKIEALQAEIDYKEKDGKLELVKVTLQGDVKLSSLETEKNKFLHYALADRVEYVPDEDVVVLKGEKGKRVLFFDKLNQMELSCETVVAKRRGESVQGVGDVRFVFKEDELAKLKERFGI